MELELAAAYHLPTDLSVCAVKNAAANAANAAAAASNALAAASAAVTDAQKFGGRGSSWSREETSLLLDVYEVEMAKEDANFDKNSASLMVPKFQSIYRTISDMLRVQGFERSPMQVRERLKRLKRDVREHKQGEFTARVSAIVGRSPYTRPSLIQQAAILNTEKMRSCNNNSITSNNNSSERSLSETFYPTDMLSTEMSYPDDDEPTSESPMSCNAEVPDGHSENEEHETENHDVNSDHGEEIKTHVLKEQHEKEKDKHTVPSAPLSLCTNSGASVPVTSSAQSTVVVPPALAALMPALIKKEKTPPPAKTPPVSRTPPRPRSVHNSTPVQTAPQPLPMLPAGFPHALPSHLSLNPAMIFGLSGSLPTQVQPRVKTPPASKTGPSTPPSNCNSCSQTAAEQKKIHNVLQKVIADQKATQESQLMFQREILAHLNMITYSIQTLAAQFAFGGKGSKETLSNSPHSQDEEVSSIHDGH